MVVAVLGLRTSGLTLNSLITSLERLCSKEDRTWKERIFNQTKLVKIKKQIFFPYVAIEIITTEKHVIFLPPIFPYLSHNLIDYY